jgi:hypothetical protein
MRKKVFIFVLSAILGLLTIPFLVHAEFYKWTDDEGNIHFTDEYSNIPEEYLPVTETQRFPKESSLPSIKEDSTPALAPKNLEPAAEETPRIFSGVISSVDGGSRTVVVTGEGKEMIFPVFEDTKIKTDSGVNVPFSELKNAMSVSVEYIKKGNDVYPLSIKISTMQKGFGKIQREKQEEQRKKKEKAPKK